MKHTYLIITALFLSFFIMAGGGIAGDSRSVVGGIEPDVPPKESAAQADGEAAAVEANPEERIYAYGDDVQIKGSDMNIVRAYLYENNIKTTPKNYLKAALEFRLFAKEAEALGIGEGSEEFAAIEDPFAQERYLAVRYLSKVNAEYAVPEIVMESYRRAYPDRFQQYNEETKSYELQPLDDVKEMIRAFIVKSKQYDIREDELERLKKKYNVVTCDPEGGCR